jgi:hypothetical protein
MSPCKNHAEEIIFFSLLYFNWLGNIENNGVKNYETNITIFITFVTYWEIQVTGKTAKKIYLGLYPKIEIALLETISKTGFWFKIPRYNPAG